VQSCVKTALNTQEVNWQGKSKQGGTHEFL
jgi:hypothetical protein